MTTKADQQVFKRMRDAAARKNDLFNLDDAAVLTLGGMLGDERTEGADALLQELLEASRLLGDLGLGEGVEGTELRLFCPLATPKARRARLGEARGHRQMDERHAALLFVAGLVGGGIAFGVGTIGMEYRLGQTPGKRLFGLQVVQESGASISLGQTVVRQLPMILQVYWLDALFGIFTEKQQRAFEVLSKTRVVLADPPRAARTEP